MKHPWLIVLSEAFTFAFKQTNYAVLRGMVLDPQYLTIPHAKV